MDTLISLRPEELTEDFYKQLQSLAAIANNIEIKINGMNAVNNLTKPEIDAPLQETEQLDDKPVAFPPLETREEYFNRLDQSIKNVEEGKVVSYTWDDFDVYTKQLLNEP